MMDATTGPMTGGMIVAQARQWLGVTWRHQGRTRTGVDCIGLVIKVAHELQLSQFDIANYSAKATDETLRDGCRQHLVEIPLATMQPGDVVVMRFSGQRHIGFLGDYCFGGLSVIHSCALHPRKVIEARLDATWRGRIMGAFRFPEVIACS